MEASLDELSSLKARCRQQRFFIASSFATSCIIGCRTASPIAAPCPLTSTPAASAAATIIPRHVFRIIEFFSMEKLLRAIGLHGQPRLAPATTTMLSSSASAGMTFATQA